MQFVCLNINVSALLESTTVFKCLNLLPKVPLQYHLINGSLIWYEAQSFCRVECTNLATVNNMDCNNMLVNTLGSHVTYSWIGLWAGGTHRQCMVRTDVSHGCVE